MMHGQKNIKSQSRVVRHLIIWRDLHNRTWPNLNFSPETGYAGEVFVFSPILLKNVLQIMLQPSPAPPFAVP